MFLLTSPVYIDDITSVFVKPDTWHLTSRTVTVKSNVNVFCMSLFNNILIHLLMYSPLLWGWLCHDVEYQGEVSPLLLICLTDLHACHLFVWIVCTQLPEDWGVLQRENFKVQFFITGQVKPTFQNLRTCWYLPQIRVVYHFILGEKYICDHFSLSHFFSFYPVKEPLQDVCWIENRSFGTFWRCICFVLAKLLLQYERRHVLKCNVLCLV